MLHQKNTVSRLQRDAGGHAQQHARAAKSSQMQADHIYSNQSSKYQCLSDSGLFWEIPPSSLGESGNLEISSISEANKINEVVYNVYHYLQQL